MAAAATSNALRLDNFDGKANSYLSWRARLGAYAHMQNCSSPMDTDDPTDPGTTAYRKANALLHAILILTTRGTDAQLVSSYPGDGRAAYKALNRLYAGSSIARKTAAIQEFNGAKMEPNEEPTAFVTGLREKRSILATVHGVSISDDQLYAVILTALPSSYRTITEILRMTDVTPDFDDLCIRLRDQFHTLGVKQLDNTQHADERGLVSQTFTGKCHNCQQRGHRARDCTHAGDIPFCSYHNKKGHSTEACNARKRFVSAHTAKDI